MTVSPGKWYTHPQQADFLLKKITFSGDVPSFHVITVNDDRERIWDLDYLKSLKRGLKEMA